MQDHFFSRKGLWQDVAQQKFILCAEKLDSLNSALLASALASSKLVGFVNGLRRFHVPISPSRRYLCFMMRQLNQWVPPCDIPLLSIAHSFPQIPKGHEKNEIDRVVHIHNKLQPCNWCGQGKENCHVQGGSVQGKSHLPQDYAKGWSLDT